MKFFILVILFFSSLFSTTVQLGAFKNQKNIKSLKNKFKHLDVYINKLSNGISVIYIKNIDEQELPQRLKEIRKSIPSAFVVKKSRVITAKKITPIEDFTTNEEDSSLDSKAIIKTRKKFFK